jgi:hypothetical protein
MLCFSFVSGHDFSRAVKDGNWAKALLWRHPTRNACPKKIRTGAQLFSSRRKPAWHNAIAIRTECLSRAGFSCRLKREFGNQAYLYGYTSLAKRKAQGLKSLRENTSIDPKP